MTCKTQLQHVSGARTSSFSLDTLWYESRADEGTSFPRQESGLYNKVLESSQTVQSFVRSSV